MSKQFFLSTSSKSYLSNNCGFSIQGDVDQFNEIALGFDLPEFDAAITEMVSKVGVEWKKKTLSLDDAGVYISYKGAYEGKSVRLARKIVVENGVRKVIHEDFVLPISLQGKGMAKSIFRTLYDQYKNAGIEVIEVVANIDIGAYAWARYGFSMTNREEIRKLVTLAYEKLFGRDLDRFLELFNEFKGDYPFPVKYLARESFGEHLLRNTTWEGVLDLRNEKDRVYFEDYLGLNLRS